MEPLTLREDMEVNFNLPRNYSVSGFELSKLDDNTLALKFQSDTIFVFTSSIEANTDFATRLCDCYLDYVAKNELVQKV